MATDATGTPTSLGIPKYNTSADAPSGLGFNAAMDAIDALIAARVTKPSGIVSGETPVWNGSGWDRSSVTRIGISSIASGTPTGSKFVRDDGVLAVPASTTITRATAPPGSPADGDTWIYVDSLTATTVEWVFRWNAGSSNTDKWEFVGGAPGEVEVAAGETTVSATYVDLTTVGPSFTIPRGGVYIITFGAEVDKTVAGGNTTARVAVKLGAAATADAESTAEGQGNTTTTATAASGTIRRTLVTSDVLKMQYKTSGDTARFTRRWLAVLPVRVS